MQLRLAAIGLCLVLVGSACSSSDGSVAPSTTRPATPSTTTVAEAGPASPGCGRPADATAVSEDQPIGVEETLTVEGTERAYHLGVPATYDPDEPTVLIMNLHGSGSNAVQASVYGGVTAAAAAKGHLTVTPDAVDGRWGLGGGDADQDFLAALVQNIKDRYCVDPMRVHLIGMSLGAWKAASVACALPDTFASIALVTVEVHPTDCPPIPAVTFHGTADATVPYGEGSGHDFPDSPNAGLPGTQENLANWAAGNECAPDPVIEEIGDDVERWTYTECTADLVGYTVFESGHTWPGEAIEIGPTTQTIDATEIAFAWFDRHPMSP